MAFIVKVLIISTLVIGFVANNVAADTIAELILSATGHESPFPKSSLNRLYGNIFGSGRSTRSTDVVIFNKSSKAFKLASYYCDHGDYSTGLFPLREVQAKEATVFGMESNGFATGVECTTKYTSSDGSYFEVTAVNPYVGGNSLRQSCSSSLRILATKGQGDNNQVRWIVEDY